MPGAGYPEAGLPGNRVVPLSAETHGRLRNPFMEVVTDLGELAVGRWGTAIRGKVQFVSLLQISVTLCQVNAPLGAER